MIMLIAVLVAFLGGVVTVPVVRSIAVMLGVVDEPGGRKIHRFCTPRMGGVAIVVGIALGVSVLLLLPINLTSYSVLRVVFIGAPLAFGLGLWDDFVGIGSRKKLIAQLILGCLLYFVGFRIDTISLGGEYGFSLGIFSFPITILWIAAIMNAVNLIDGVDGLAAGTSSIMFGVFGLLAASSGDTTVAGLSLICLGATSAFLMFNFAPARIFMGDSGSMLIGLMLAVLSMSISPVSSKVLPIYVPLFALSLPILDMTVAIMRRFVQ